MSAVQRNLYTRNNSYLNKYETNSTKHVFIQSVLAENVYDPN